MKFYEYSSEFWREYKSIAPALHPQRLCKIYAENEDGVYLPVTKYVLPLTSIRGVDSPFHAARFVSLIPLLNANKNDEN